MRRCHLWLIGLMVIAIAYGGFTLINALAMQPSTLMLEDWQDHNRTLQKLEINELQAKKVYEDALSAGEKAGARWSDMVSMMTAMGMEIDANMKLYTVLSRDIQPALAELNYEMTLLNNEAISNGLLLTLRNKIYETAEAACQVQSQMTSLAGAQEAFRQGEHLYMQGKLEEKDYLDLEYQVSQAEVNVKSAERSLSDKQGALNSFIGVSPDQVYELTKEESMNATELDAVDTYIKQALAERPEMQNLRRQIAIKKEELAAYKRIFDDMKMDDDMEASYQAVKDDLLRLDIELQLMTKNIEKEIRSLYLDVKIAQDRIIVLWNQVRGTTDTINQMQANYQEGNIILTELIEAENHLASVKASYQASIYQYNTLRMQLDFLAKEGCGGA